MGFAGLVWVWILEVETSIHKGDVGAPPLLVCLPRIYGKILRTFIFYIYISLFLLYPVRTPDIKN